MRVASRRSPESDDNEGRADREIRKGAIEDGVQNRVHEGSLLHALSRSIARCAVRRVALRSPMFHRD